MSFKNNDKMIEYFLVEINHRMKKWSVLCSYNPHLQFLDKYLTHIRKGLD